MRTDPRATAAAGLATAATASTAVPVAGQPDRRQTGAVTPSGDQGAPRVSGAHRTRRCRSSGTDGPALRASRSEWPEVVALGRARVDRPDQVDGDHLHHPRDRHQATTGGTTTTTTRGTTTTTTRGTTTRGPGTGGTTAGGISDPRGRYHREDHHHRGDHHPREARPRARHHYAGHHHRGDRWRVEGAARRCVRGVQG